MRLWREMDPRLKRLLLADCLARWAEGIPRVFVALYVLDVLGLSPLAFGWLIVLQRVTNVAVYLPLAPLSDRMNRKPFVLVTFAFFALFFRDHTHPVVTPAPVAPHSEPATAPA